MAVEFRSAWQGTQGTVSTSLVLSKPAGVVDGDLLIAFVHANGGSAAVAPTITPPAGWTLVTSAALTTGGTNGNGRFAAYSKVASGEGASWGFTISGETSNGPHHGSVIALTGASGVNVSSFSAEPGSPYWEPPSVTPTVEDAFLLSGVVQIGSIPTLSNVPLGTIPVVDLAGAAGAEAKGGRQHAVGYQRQHGAAGVTTGSEGRAWMVAAESYARWSIILAVTPSAVTPAAPVGALPANAGVPRAALPRRWAASTTVKPASPTFFRATVVGEVSCRGQRIGEGGANPAAVGADRLHPHCAVRGALKGKGVEGVASVLVVAEASFHMDNTVNGGIRLAATWREPDGQVRSNVVLPMHETGANAVSHRHMLGQRVLTFPAGSEIALRLHGWRRGGTGMQQFDANDYASLCAMEV